MLPLRKEIREPWLRYIEEGTKRYEGRLATGTWAQIPIGSTVVAYSNEREVTLRIVNIHHFSDFGEAWAKLGAELIPKEFGVTSKEQANKIYSEFWPLEEIEKGVIAIEVERI